MVEINNILKSIKLIRKKKDIVSVQLVRIEIRNRRSHIDRSWIFFYPTMLFYRYKLIDKLNIHKVILKKEGNKQVTQAYRVVAICPSKESHPWQDAFK